jgi:hypothetical protein
MSATGWEVTALSEIRVLSFVVVRAICPEVLVKSMSGCRGYESLHATVRSLLGNNSKTFVKVSNRRMCLQATR